MLYGFYSNESVKLGNPTFIYTTPTGKQIVVSMVNRNPHTTSRWDDLKCVGEMMENNHYVFFKQCNC